MERLSMGNTVAFAIPDAAQHVGTTHPGAAGPTGAAGQLSETIGKHSYWCIGNAHCVPKGFFGGEFNVDTILMTWLVMVLLLALAFVVRSRLSLTRPRGAQNVLEFAFEFVNGLVSDGLGVERVSSIGPLAVAMFLFILISNYIGLIPVPIEGWHSPTSDLNTTVGLALMVFILIQIMSLRGRGVGGYFKHFTQPFAALTLLTVIEEFSKPVTLSFRLFGNIFAGEVLLLVFSTLLQGILIVVLPVADAILGFGLGLFIGAIQAFIFTILTVSYIGIAISTEGH
jgi:F-type H+-transporting ATPase subunit a